MLTDQKEPKPLVRLDSCVLAPAVRMHSQLCWNRCCVPLISDPKILGMLGHLGSGESSGGLSSLIFFYHEGCVGFLLKKLFSI